MRRRVLLTVLLGLLAAPSNASAATTCDFTSGVLQVDLGAAGDQATLTVAPGGEIQVFVNGVVPCTGGPATVTNTNAIAVVNHPGSSNNLIRIQNAGAFAPGLIAEPGSDEIEIYPTLNDAPGSRLVFDSLSGGIRFGDAGINPNATVAEETPDADIFPAGVATMEASGTTGPDTLGAQGGLGTGNPLESRITFSGGSGADVLTGGAGGDSLAGGTGADTIYGLSGSDSLFPGRDDDLVDGGGGTDTAAYPDHAAGVTVDLALTGPQATGGSGIDRIVGAENLQGTTSADVLRGDSGPNVVVGTDGDDELEGRGGPDELGGNNGSDVLHARDGGPDRADCGPGADTVIADLAGVDTTGVDCEARDFNTRPDTSFASGPSGPTRDATPTFAFSSSEPGSAFECSLDSAAFAACPRTLTTPRLTDGVHSLRVAARDVFEALDLAPAARTFTVDTKRPSISRAKIAKRFKLGRRRTAVTAAGSSFRYRLSESGTMRLKVQRCVRLRRKRCRRYRTVRTLARRARKGTNRHLFSGRIRGVRARTGLFRATLTATDRAGNHSRAKRLGFRIAP